MRRRTPEHFLLTCNLALALALQAMVPVPASAQFRKRLIQAAACGGGAVAGVKLGEKVAEFEAQRLKLSPEEAAKHRRAFQIGLALALCGGGAAIAGTTYSKLSERGRKNREKELMAALDDAEPRNYSDPDRPGLAGTFTPQPLVTEGNQQCRVVEDYLAEGAQGDRALIKYCRPNSGGDWQVKAF